MMSLPTRERGLKRRDGTTLFGRLLSLPTRERGLKQASMPILLEYMVSLPTRERGLKHAFEGLNKSNLCRSLRGSVD